MTLIWGKKKHHPAMFLGMAPSSFSQQYEDASLIKGKASAKGRGISYF